MRSLPFISLATCLCAPVPVMAQDGSIPILDDSEAGEELEVHGNEILVLAPRVLGQLDIPQQPIEVFDEEDIASYGANSIEELLEAISPQTNSGRGRGDGRPVMLLNGQRITSFREMRRIPPEAIRRMEVLPEEVALRFGYPANQRVVNIILKDQFAAMTGAGEYNRPTRGGYDNYELEAGLFKIAGPRRYNVTAKVDETTMLTEAERNVRQQDGNIPDVAGDPDPARYRSLADAEREVSLEGTMTQGLGDNGLAGSLTASGGYTHTRSRSLSGLDMVTLSYDGQSALRSLPDPLTTRITTDAFEAGLGYNKMLGDWQLSTTFDGSYTKTLTRVDRRRDVSALEDAAAAGELAIDGALPVVPGAGVDEARNRALSMTSLATLSGAPFRMPAGDASLTLNAGYNFDRTRSEDTRNTLGTVKLKRGDLQGGLNLALPLTSRGEDFLGAVGDLTLNLSGGLDRLSDFGTLTDWSAGVTWSPVETLTFQASYLVNQAAPSLSQLGAPTILTYNVPVYDFANATTALVTVTSGGNPDLVKEKQRDIKLSATWNLPFLDRSNLVVEYFRNRSSNVTQSFPLLTPAIEAAFPDRITRDGDGNLVAIDRRAVTYDEVSSSRVRWGINLSGNLGSSSDAARPGPGGAAPAPAPAASPRPGADAPSQRRFDPERFARMREALCGEGTPDLASLPERMAERLRGADGKIDPERLAAARARMCTADGVPPPPGARPERGAPEGAAPGERRASSGPGAGGPSPTGGMRRPRGGRWHMAIYHTWRFTDRVRIAEGVPVLNQLAGDAITSGGVPRHAIEAEGGVFKNGYGLRFNAEWDAPARVNGTGLPGSSDLRFGSTFRIDMRLFADLGSNENLVEKVPFLKGSRLAFTVDNLLDSRQKVTDENGEVPIAYQAAFREPQGRVIGIDFRKMF
ncbi:TonB-dependent receptor plug domain-containing protein [Novosphingobium mangrovi (ex Huang et al. 2023)]|uniref:TonB-dependent receptor n=1 Tax=Novosphingobium mangrovi (ex Huang et al. 2023) TaxID=2976432 RepID=A0ABT2I8S5_9SPHN|nr:TonB-dependent receptor [Novosphingobium mangrovi (ex Huang et al. 2023)]MCT2400947.1 TonB-dependent receptor [Novosphingobium mangrovi (ex Huang et al. 2023)]